MCLLWTSKRYFIIVAIETSFIKTGKTINKFVNLVYFYFFLQQMMSFYLI